MTWVKYPDKVNKYYDPKWSSQGYKYWQYKPWMVKDNWKPLKKNGRKKWTTLKTRVEVANEMGQIVNLMTFGVKKVNWENNIANGVKSNTPLSVPQACEELGMKSQSFYHYLKKFPEVKDEYELLKENRREYMKELSESNIQKALSWKMKTLQEKDIVDYSFKMLERTDKNYNPKQVQEVIIEEINIDRSTDDILADITDLLKV